MLQAKIAIRAGLKDYQRGYMFIQNPYPTQVREHEMGYHGVAPVGVRRVAIDYSKLWAIGWNLGEMLALAQLQENKLARPARLKRDLCRTCQQEVATEFINAVGNQVEWGFCKGCLEREISRGYSEHKFRAGPLGVDYERSILLKF